MLYSLPVCDVEVVACLFCGVRLAGWPVLLSQTCWWFSSNMVLDVLVRLFCSVEVVVCVLSGVRCADSPLVLSGVLVCVFSGVISASLPVL